MYNFDKKIDRRGTSSVKWDKVDEVFNQEDIIPLWVADSDWQTAPEIIESIKNRVEHGVFGYTFPAKEYKDVIVDWYKKRYDWEIKPDWIVLLSGVVPGINIALKALTRPGDSVIIQPPVYYPFFSAVKNNGNQLLENQLVLREENGSKRYEIDWLDLENKIKKNPGVSALIFCYPHNPVGRVWQPGELNKLLDMAAKYDLLIISDEIHADFVYNGQHRPLGSIRPELNEQIITISAPSKTFNIAGLATAYAIIPDSNYQKKFNQSSDGIQPALNPLGLTALKAAYQDGEEWLASQNKYIESNYKLVRDKIVDIPGIEMVESEGTYLVWLDFRETELSDQELEDLLFQEAGVGLEPGRWFGRGGEGFFRMNLATQSSNLEEALKRLENLMLTRFPNLEEDNNGS
ncbi:MAG: MalY/PatB family protein [Bacillota bacterium]